MKKTRQRLSESIHRENRYRDSGIEFHHILEQRISRRGFLNRSGLGISALVVGSSAVSSCASQAPNGMNFIAVASNTDDTVSLPVGYNYHVVSSWGDGLWSNSLRFDESTCGTGHGQELSMGDSNDGMEIFEYQGRTILAVNNEYTNNKISFSHRKTNLPETDDDIRKSKAAHGITICELAQTNGRWKIVRDSEFNRRIIVDSEMEITGPARGHKKLKTKADPMGTKSFGTWANCGCGRTPWGTYLTCEENFQGYFSSSNDDIKIKKSQLRYGIGVRGRGHNWKQTDERFDIAKSPNEANRCGYVVEINPLDPNSTPKKRTALGRFSHENAELVISEKGNVVVYLGDDARGEFLYKFISKEKFEKQNPNPDILEDGTLFAARFNDDGSGEWLELSPDNTGMESKAHICVNTRFAASRVKATTMDRPEWVSANPHKAEAYCALTNNKSRGIKTNRGGDKMPANGPNPRTKNLYGQILRWRPENSDHISAKFTWDLFAVAGNPQVHSNEYAGSANINRDNMFNSPDGLKFDRNGLLWIQTDGPTSNEGHFEGMGNNQMLIADPVSGEIKRFMVGPVGCEITGIDWSLDYKTVFVGIQHPKGNFPNGGNTIPRSSIIAIQRDDGKALS